MTWNNAGTPSQVAGTSVTANYTYDGFGLRVKRVVGGTTEFFIYGQSGELLEKHDGTNRTDYIYVEGRPIGIFTPGGGGTRYYVHADHLGVPQKVTDGSKATVWSSRYKAFGETVGASGSVMQDIRFPGQHIDVEALLHHNGFREYSPEMGRYLSSDPIGLAGGTNTYGYVGQNPVNRTDTWGLANVSKGITGAVGESSLHAFPGPNVIVGGRVEHGPPHVHLGGSGGPAVSTDTFEPLTRKDAQQMTREQLKFCRALTPEERATIRLRASTVYATGGFKVLTALSVVDFALKLFTGQDPFGDIPTPAEVFGDPNRVY